MPDSVDVSDWRQGDVCLDVADIPFLASDDEIEGLNAHGAVLVSQTCDVLRDYEDRRFVQVARLVKVRPELMTSIKKFQRPRYASIPALEDHSIVADLDVIATVDKQVLAKWSRIEGCRTPFEHREFGYALGRHKSRFALPDEWARGLSKLRRWVQEKGNRNGEDGRFIRAVYQMRAEGDVDADFPEQVTIICILEDGWNDADRAEWVAKMLPKLKGLVDSKWCSDASFIITAPEEMTVAEYLSSYRLDFDSLTMSS